MKSLKDTILTLGFATVSLGVANAANINIFDGPPITPEGTVRIEASQFEGGFFVNGALIQPPGLGGGAIDVKEGVPADFFGQWIAPGGFVPVDRLVYFVEAGNPNVVSDIFQYHAFVDDATGLGTIQGRFLSEVEGQPLGTVPPGAEVFVEGGRPFTFSLPFLTGQVYSDADPVPENGAGLAGLLTLVGVCILGYFSRRTLATA